MDLQNTFTEKDKERIVEFLNLISTHAEFNLKTTEIIKYFHLLSFMQKELLPKITSNILEVKKIHKVEAKENS